LKEKEEDLTQLKTQDTHLIHKEIVDLEAETKIVAIKIKVSPQILEDAPKHHP